MMYSTLLPLCYLALCLAALNGCTGRPLTGESEHPANTTTSPAFAEETLQLDIASASAQGGLDDEDARGLEMEGITQVERPDIALEICAERLGTQTTLPQHGGSLHTGDRIWIEVELHGPVYLYILQISPAGQATVLYPGNGVDRKEQPGRVRVPAEGWVRLDHTVGMERALFVATREPISQLKSTAALSGYFGAASAAGPVPAAPTPVFGSKYSPRVRMRTVPKYAARAPIVRAERSRMLDFEASKRAPETRGLILEVQYASGSFSQFGYLDPDGVLAIPVTFEHVRRP